MMPGTSFSLFHFLRKRIFEKKINLILFLIFVFLVLAYFVIPSTLAPEWFLRLIFTFLLLAVPTPFLLRKCFVSNSSLVTEKLLVPGREFEKNVMGTCARIIFMLMASAFVFSLVTLSEDVLDLAKNGQKVLIHKRAIVKTVDALGASEFLYRIIYLDGETDSYDEYLSMSSGYGLWKGTTWDFIILRKSRIILEAHMWK